MDPHPSPMVFVLAALIFLVGKNTHLRTQTDVVPFASGVTSCMHHIQLLLVFFGGA